MSLFDGNGSEMPEHRPIEDGTVEAALAGSTRGETVDTLSSFVSSVRSAVEAVPTPSTALAAVLAAGFSTEKGDLSATAASNVIGPAEQASGLSKWRKLKMKIQGFLAGLGVAGKVALGVGVAAAATTGAGATGMLPFSHGAGGSHHHGVVAIASTTTTQKAVAAIPHAKRAHAKQHHKVVRAPAPHHVGTSSSHTGTSTPPTTEVTTTTVFVPPVTPTPSTTPPTEPTPTTVYDPPPPPSTTTTTAPPTQPPPTQSIQLSCALTGTTQVTCTWTASPTPGVQYALWRWKTGGDGSDYGSIFASGDTLTFVDNNVVAGVPYTYRVFTTIDGTSGPWSNRSYIT